MGKSGFAVPGAVFHRSGAQITAGQTPRLRKVGHAIMDIGLGHRKFGERAAEAKHARCRRQNLHQADFANAANRAGIESAFHPHHRLGDFRRETGSCGLFFDQRTETRACIGSSGRSSDPCGIAVVLLGRDG